MRIDRKLLKQLDKMKRIVPKQFKIRKILARESYSQVLQRLLNRECVTR